MTINSDRVKEIMKSLGADLCGIASLDRFASAPEGYHPTNDSEWDVKTNRWRSIVSQKHAAQAAGLGTKENVNYIDRPSAS